MTDPLASLAAALTGRYVGSRELGAGGMATVYLAEDTKHHRQVAVKVLRAELAASLGAERFLREIGIAARLHHPHILSLYDSGGEGDVLEERTKVTGELRDLTRGDPRIWRLARRHTTPLCASAPSLARSHRLSR